jgi:FixJ family two-component response regulator
MSAPTAQIAIVDDDASVRKALMRLLQASSYTVDTYGSASEFLASLNRHIPNCLIVDLQMPSTNGLELRVSLTRAGIVIPTIVISAHDEPGSRERCRAAGAAAYLLKPIRKKELIAANQSSNRRHNVSFTKDGCPALLGARIKWMLARIRCGYSTQGALSGPT